MKASKSLPLALLVALLVPPVPAQAHEKRDVTITQAWIRSSEYSDHVGGMTGIFARIKNNTNHEVILLGGKTRTAPMVQTHEVVGGIMRQKSGGIVIPAGKTVTLQPGGLHVMIMDLKRAIRSGARVHFTFAFKGARSQTILLLAKPAAAGGENYTHKTTTE